MTQNEQCTVRPAVIADLEAICVVMRHPDVSKNQYRLDEASWFSFAQEAIQSKEPRNIRIDVIATNGDVAGYVITRLVGHGAMQYGYLSFNLQPQFWGRGIMASSLTKIIDELFRCDQVKGLMVECFSSNHQCRRLLQKLGFARVRIPVLERLARLATRVPIRWVLRYWLKNPAI